MNEPTISITFTLFKTKQSILFCNNCDFRQWRYNNTHIRNVDTLCRCDSASRGGRFNLRKQFPVAKGQKSVWTSYPILTLCGERFLSLQQYNPDPSVNKSKHKLITFNNAVHPNSVQHWPSSEPAISSASQGNPALHESEDSSPSSKQPTTCADPSEVSHCQNFRYYFLKININIIFPSAPRSC